MIELLSVQGSTLLNTPTTHRRTPGPSTRGVATPHSAPIDADGESLCGFHEPIQTDPDSPQDAAELVVEGARGNGSGVFAIEGRILFANGTIQEACTSTRTQNGIDGSIGISYPPPPCPPSL